MQMINFPSLLILGLAIGFMLVTPMSSFAEGIGTVTQIGASNDAYVYQEVLSEVIILQLGEDNSSSIEQVGAEHLAGIVQVGEKNEIGAKQLSQRDLLFSIQSGYRNSAIITQMHALVGSPSRACISNNDAFTYQTGIYNTLSLVQIGDDNTASIYQLESNNEAFIVQEQTPLSSGSNAALVVQIGIGNLVTNQQAGTHQVSQNLQMGNDNLTLINQSGRDNSASVSQTGNQNSVAINQG